MAAPPKKIMQKMAKQDSGARFMALAHLYAQSQGIAGRRSGWLYRPGREKALVQGWSSFARLYRTAILDWATSTLTASKTFAALLNQPAGYYPTLRWDLDWRNVVLAEAYNVAQMRRGDPRRAYTPDIQFVDWGERGYRLIFTPSPALSTTIQEASDARH